MQTGAGSGHPAGDRDVLASAMETDLYAMGAYFTDRHPELADEVVAASDEVQRVGLERYAGRPGETEASAYQTLVTGLAVRYYRALTG